MDNRTKRYLVVGALVGAGVAVAWWVSSSFASWIGGLFGAVTGKEGTSSASVDKPDAGSIAGVAGHFVDPTAGGNAEVKAGGSTYPVVVELVSAGGAVHGNVRVHTVEKPWLDAAQSFDFTWTDVVIPSNGKALLLKGDIDSMTILQAPISAAIGRAVLAQLYFEDKLLAAIPYTASGSILP